CRSCWLPRNRMQRPANNRDSLRKLERLRELQLEQAQVEHAHAAGDAESKRRVLQQTEVRIAEAHAFARERLEKSRALSVESLLGIRLFAALQEQQLDTERTAWRTSQDQCDSALSKVVERLAELSVIERLRERRRGEATKAQARLEQKRLDEQGLVHRG